MKKGNILILFAFFCLGSATLYSQQLPLYSQYVLNSYLLNPAIAGSDGFTSVNLTSRRQWLGYKEGPQTYSLSAQSRLLKRRKKAVGGRVQGARSGNVGVGGNVFADRNGAITKTGASFSYAYHIHLQNTSQISLGISGSIIQVGIDKSKLIFDVDEPLMYTLGRNIYYPDASVGAFWSNSKGFLGISADQLFQSALKFTDRDLQYRMLRQYYLLGGYNIPLGDIYDLEPSFLLKTNEKLTTQVDLGLKFFVSKNYWLGAYYRTAYKGTYIISAGIRYNEFIFGYAFDYSNSSISNATYGSHEFILAMKFGDSARRYKWLDRY